MTSHLHSIYSARLARHTYPVPLRLLFVSSVAGAVLLSLLAASHPHFPGDVAIVQGIQTLSSPWLDHLMQGIALLGTEVFIIGGIVGIGAVLALFRRRKDAVLLLLILIPEGLVMLLKPVIGRPRPTEELVHVIDISATASFPSGHTYHVMLLAGLLILFSTASIQNRWLRDGIVVVLSCLICLTAFSRLYLGAHWPSDILGSILFAIPTLFIFYKIYVMFDRYPPLQEEGSAIPAR